MVPFYNELRDTITQTEGGISPVLNFKEGNMARRYEQEDGRPEDWRSEVVYVRNPDGTITELEEGESDDADDTQG